MIRQLRRALVITLKNLAVLANSFLNKEHKQGTLVRIFRRTVNRLYIQGIRLHLWGTWIQWMKPFIELKIDENFSPNYEGEISRLAKTPYSPVEKRVMNLIYAIPPKASNGYAIRSHGLLKGINQRGWKVDGIMRMESAKEVNEAGGLNRDNFKQYEYDSVRYHQIKAGTLDAETLFLLSSFQGIFRPEYYQVYYWRALELAHKMRPALIHSASNFCNGLVGAALARTLNVPSIYEFRGLWELTRSSREGTHGANLSYQVSYAMETKAAMESTHVIAITDTLKEVLVGRGVPEEKISVLPNGVDSHHYDPMERDLALEEKLGLKGKIVVGYVGSVVDYEGLEMLAEAAALLIKDPKIAARLKIMIVGDGKAMPSIHESVKHHGVESYFLFTGRVPHTEVKSYYSLIDICPLPRKPEPVCEIVSPLKPFECMAMEKVVVVSSVKALKELILDEKTGLIFEKGNASDLAAKIKRLIEDEALRTRIGKESRKWVLANRDWSHVTKKLSEIYSKVCQDWYSTQGKNRLAKNTPSIDHESPADHPK